MKNSVHIQGTRFSLLKETIEDQSSIKLSTRMGESSLIWSDEPLENPQWSQLRSKQQTNHFPESSRICRKSNVLFSLEKLKQQFPKDFLFYPYTWFLPTHRDSLESYFAKGMWVVGQVEGRKHSSFYSRSMDNFASKSQYIVQKYIDNPLILNHNRFDIRIYAIVRSCQPLVIYLYKQGLVKFGPFEEPSEQGKPGRSLHKYNKNMLIQEDMYSGIIGNKRTLSAVFSYLEQKGCNIQKIESQIQDIIIKTICAIQPQLLMHSQKTRARCFQVLGFNFTIDSYTNPWLVSVKHSPSFSCSTSVDFAVKKHFLDSVLKLVMKKTAHGFKKIFPNGDYRYQQYLLAAENMWQDFSGMKSPRVRSLPPLQPRNRFKPTVKKNKPKKSARKIPAQRLGSSVPQARNEIRWDMPELTLKSNRNDIWSPVVPEENIRPVTTLFHRRMKS